MIGLLKGLAVEYHDVLPELGIFFNIINRLRSLRSLTITW